MFSCNSLKKIYIFLSAFLIGIFAVSAYQMVTSNINRQNLAVENPVFNIEQSQKRKKKNEPSGFSEQRESESDRRYGCLNYCRVCKCDDSSSNVRSIEVKSEISSNSKPLQITYKPRPQYTEAAKLNNIQGNVRVRVTFLPSGKIGSVSEVSRLPFGLTEKAIEAAKKIKFKPQTHNGRAVAVTKVVVFTFTIY